MAEHVLTTVDNPFNPVTQFHEWYAWDLRVGHDTLGLLGRVMIVSDSMSEADEAMAIEDAIEEIVRENVSGMHRMVSATTGFPE